MSRNSLLKTGAKSGCCFESLAVTETSDFAPVSSTEFLNIQATIECGFNLKCVRDVVRTHSQIKKVVKEDVYDEWVNNVDAIDTSKLVKNRL